MREVVLANSLDVGHLSIYPFLYLSFIYPYAYPSVGIHGDLHTVHYSSPCLYGRCLLGFDKGCAERERKRDGEREGCDLPYRRVPHGGRVRGRGREGIVGFRFWLREKKGGLEGSQGADPKDEDCEDGEGEADGVEV